VRPKGWLFSWESITMGRRDSLEPVCRKLVCDMCVFAISEAKGKFPAHKRLVSKWSHHNASGYSLRDLGHSHIDLPWPSFRIPIADEHVRKIWNDNIVQFLSCVFQRLYSIAKKSIFENGYQACKIIASSQSAVPWS